MPRIRLQNGLHLYYRERGTGEPLLLIMGTAADHTFWSAQLPAFAAAYRVIVFDARGVGRSDTPGQNETCTMAAMADDAAGLLEALDIESAHLSGLSLGSAVAQEMALRHPGRVRSLQLHGTWARADEWFKRMIDTLESPIKRGDDRRTFIRTALMWILSPQMLEDSPSVVAEMEKAFLESENPPTRTGILGHCHADKHHDTRDRLALIRVHTLVTAGERDIQVPPRYGREVAAAIPRARFHLFKGPRASHLACLEMSEEWNRVGLSFLRSLAG
ncbi:MAG: alpha/beta fold hydrolase [Acidobacteriota bacterium]